MMYLAIAGGRKLLFVISLAPDVVMQGNGFYIIILTRISKIQISLDDGFYSLVAVLSKIICPCTGTVQTFIANLFGQTEDTLAGPVCLFGMLGLVKDLLYIYACVHPNLFGAFNKTLRGPVCNVLMA